MVINIVISNPKPKIFIASSSLSGNIIANSYLPLTIVPKIVIIATKIAYKPKSSGVYSRVKIGLIAIGIAWEIVEPVINVSTF